MSKHDWTPATSLDQVAKTVRQSVIVRAGTGPFARCNNNNNSATVAGAPIANKAPRNSARSRKQPTSCKDVQKPGSWKRSAPRSTSGSRESGTPWNGLPDLVSPTAVTPVAWPLAGHHYQADRPPEQGADQPLYRQSSYGFPQSSDEDLEGSVQDREFSNSSSRRPSLMPDQRLLVLASSRPDFTMHLNTSETYPAVHRRVDPPGWYAANIYDTHSPLAYQPPAHYGPHPAVVSDSQCSSGNPLSSQGLQNSPAHLTGHYQPQPNCYTGYGYPLPTSVGSLPLPLDQADSDGDIALHIAVAKEDETTISHLIQLMLSSRLSVDICNKLQQTALHLAVITANVNIIERLLMAGACPSLPDRHGNNAIHLAVRSSTLEALKLLLEYPMSSKALRRYNYSGYTPLHLAVFRRDLDILSLLIAKGADCNCLDGTSGRTPLFHAVLNGQDDVVARLICLGASVNMANFAGITPLVVATDRRLKNITSLLIAKGATVNCREET